MPPSLIHFRRRLAFFGIHGTLGRGVGCFGGAARRAAVGETGFVRLQLELFCADHTDFDRKSHSRSMIRRGQGAIQVLDQPERSRSLILSSSLNAHNRERCHKNLDLL
jgi:hypothetical protein